MQLLLTVILCLVLIGLDRLSKIIAVQALMPAGVLPAIPGVFEWRYIENTGAAFSFLAGRQTVLIIITGIALLVLAYILLFRRPKDKLEYISFILIFSGGVGNFIDRVAQGYVVDYISLLFMDFAIFNVADIYVCVGFALLVFAVCHSEYRKKKAEKSGQLDQNATTGGVVNGKDETD